MAELYGFKNNFVLQNNFYIIISIDGDTLNLMGKFDSLTIYQEELTSDSYLEIQQFYIDFLLGQNAFVLSLYR